MQNNNRIEVRTFKALKDGGSQFYDWFKEGDIVYEHLIFSRFHQAGDESFWLTSETIFNGEGDLNFKIGKGFALHDAKGYLEEVKSTQLKDCPLYRYWVEWGRNQWKVMNKNMNSYQLKVDHFQSLRDSAIKQRLELEDVFLN